MSREKQIEEMARDIQDIKDSIKRYNKKTPDISHNLVKIKDEFTGGSKIWLTTDFFRKVVDLVLHANFIIKLCEMVLQTEGYRKQSEGEWIAQGIATPKCSVCGRYGYYKDNFCPNCGAKMKGGE